MPDALDLPGMNDTTVIIIVLLAIAASTIIGFIYMKPAEQPASSGTQGLGANADLLQFVSDAHLYTVTRRERHAWFGGIVVALALIAVVSWTSQRDERDRVADRILHDKRLPVALAKVRCPPADALEKLLVTVGTQADGKAPQIYCTYITAETGRIPRIHFGKAQVVAAQ